MKNLEDFEKSRAEYNLMEAVKYRTILEWTSRMLKQGIYSKKQIAEEIDKWLKENK